MAHPRIMDDWTPDTVDRLSIDEELTRFPSGSILRYDTDDPSMGLVLLVEPGGWRCTAVFRDPAVVRDIEFEPTFETVAHAFAFYDNLRQKGAALL